MLLCIILNTTSVLWYDDGILDVISLGSTGILDVIFEVQALPDLRRSYVPHVRSCVEFVRKSESACIYITD